MNDWFDHILLHIRRRPEQPALIMEDRVVTYGMLGAAIDGCARRIVASGLDPAGPVAVLVRNPIRHVVLCLALFRIGIPSISIEHGQRGATSLGLPVVLGDDEAKAIGAAFPRFIAVTDDWFAPQATAAEALPAPFRGAAQICRSGLTSGTTGAPKLFDYSVGHIGRHVPGAITDDCARVLDMPGLSAAWGFRAACATLAMGRTLCFAQSPFQAIRMIELFLIDLVVLGTEQLVALTRAARKTGAQLRNLRTVVVGGGIPTRALLEATAIHLCRDIRCRYGTSEFGIVAEARPSEVMSNPGLVGHVVPEIEIAAFDPAGVRCPPGQAGIIKGRLKHDQEGAGADAGWIDFGDVGWITSAGQLYVTARTADAAIEGRGRHDAAGISPAHEVEHLLRLEWDMTDAAAVAISDGGGAPQIWIATVDGKDVSVDRLTALLHTRGINLPIRLFALPSIPRAANGKVNRAELKAAILLAQANPQG